MEWWQKIILPLQRLCSGVASRFRCRKTGLLVLHRDVKACEYEDVHIMWEMLNKSERGGTRLSPPARTKNRPGLCNNMFRWARFAPCLQITTNSHD